MSISISDSTLEKFTTFGDLLRFLRRRAGITQLELSIAVGYSDAQISRLEQNLRPPDISTVEARFVSALGIEDEPKAVARLLELAANVRREYAPGLGICPYKGLNYFDEADSDLFVGREALTDKLTERIFSLIPGRSPSKARFLAVVGASGSGKSSLVRAGLVPALRWNKNSIDWQIHILTPTAHPLESLAASLTHESNSVTATMTFMDDLAQDPRSLQTFAKRKLDARDGSHLLLVVDQLEEVFALCRSEEERASFIGNLLTATSEVDGPVIAVVALRADFYAYCAKYPQLREALAENQEYIGAMTDEELRRAIEEPAQRGRWEFEPGLVDLLLHDVGREPGALPLLSHALLETWKRRRGRVMTLSGYTSAGGVRGAIAETAEAVFADRFTHEQHEIARRIFLRLTELGDETATGDTRRRAGLEELILKPEQAKTTQDVLKVLADARLIVTDEFTVEVSHEALIREWPRLRGWLEDNREDLRLHRRLTEAAQEWDDLGREPEYLYRGARLTQAREWAETHAYDMNELELSFLHQSIARMEQEAADREAQRQRELETARRLAESERQRAEEQTGFAKQLSRRAMYLTGALIVALLMAFTALYFGSQARQTAVTAQVDKRIATARELAAASINNLDVDPERSILLALHSVDTTRLVDGTVLPESLEALHRAIVSSPIRMRLDGHGTGVLSASYSPDGSQLATIGEDGTVIVWDPTDGKEILRLPGTTEPKDYVTPKRLAYSADGKLLVSCDANLVKVYDPATGSLIKTLEGHEKDVVSIAVSADGKTIASGGIDGSLILWDVSGGSPRRLEGHSKPVEAITFSPDGKWLVTAGDESTLKIWEVSSGKLLQDYSGFKTVIPDLAFSPDGRRFVFSDETIYMWEFDAGSPSHKELFSIPGAVASTFSPDGSLLAGYSGNDIKVWDAATGEELRTLIGHSGWVMGLAFSPDGRTLASTSLDGSVRIWDISQGSETISVTSPVAGFGTRVTYSPNGQEFATSGGDGTVTLWNSETGEPRLRFGHEQEVLSLAYSPDGGRIVTGSLDETIIIWDTAAGNKLLTLPGHVEGVRDVAFSPDGELIASGGFDGIARVWDAASGELIHEITEHLENLVLGVAFSPDGKSLATSSTDATVAVWDVTTGEHRYTLVHGGVVREVTYSPDGTLIATGGGDGAVIMWNAADGSQFMALGGHSSGIQSIAFSPDGKFLATGSEDNTAKLFDVATGQEIYTLPGSSNGVYGVAFRPGENNNQVLVASKDGVTRTFLIEVEELLDLAQSRITRSLTPDECKRFLHLEACPE